MSPSRSIHFDRAIDPKGEHLADGTRVQIGNLDLATYLGNWKWGPCPNGEMCVVEGIVSGGRVRVPMGPPFKLDPVHAITDDGRVAAVHAPRSAAGRALRFFPARTLHLRVQEPDGSPVPNLWLQPRVECSYLVAPSAATDAKGEVRLPLLPDEGFGHHDETDIDLCNQDNAGTVALHDGVVEATITLPAKVEVVLRAVDSHSGKPRPECPLHPLTNLECIDLTTAAGRRAGIRRYRIRKWDHQELYAGTRWDLAPGVPQYLPWGDGAGPFDFTIPVIRRLK